MGFSNRIEKLEFEISEIKKAIARHSNDLKDMIDRQENDKKCLSQWERELIEEYKAQNIMRGQPT